MPIWLTEPEYEALCAVLEVLVPSDQTPGAVEAGVADYIDGLLGAFAFDPPRIWAGGPTSGRAGGEAAFDRFIPLGALEELAWRIRLEGSQGLPEREFNGPVEGLQARYRTGLAALGEGFAALPAEARTAALSAAPPDFVSMVYAHACEGMYGAPEYGGNRDGSGWSAIGFAGDVQPRGWSDEDVAGP